VIVAVLAGTAEEVRADLRALDLRRATVPTEVGAEIRLDLMDPPDVGVFGNAPVPLIATCRRPRDGGRFRGAEADRLDLLRRAAAAGAKFVDIELDALDSFGPGAGTGVIASYHDFEITPPDVASYVLRLLGPGVAMVKVATRTRSLLDLMTLANAVRQAPGRVVAVGLGSAGAASRILADRIGSAWTNVRFSADGRAAPRELVEAGVPELSEFLGFYRGGVLDRDTPAFAVVGDRADESIGPKVFNRVLRDRRLGGTYVHLKTPSLAGLRETCKLLNIRGLSVTTPFKESVLAAADEVDPGAQAIGAANTVVAAEGGWLALNTDRDGIAVPLRALLAKRGQSPRGLAVLVAGAGGMGRAAAAAVTAMGCRVAMLSRDQGRLRQATQALGVEMVTDASGASRPWDVLINATPAGSSRDPKGTAIDPSWASPQAIVIETNYRPVATPLVLEARKRGLDVIGGDQVYAAQAAVQLGIFLPTAGDQTEAIRAATAAAL
jgi:3-dehydroquinate dehydratase/shikimate dehydrogenase